MPWQWPAFTQLRRKGNEFVQIGDDELRESTPRDEALDASKALDEPRSERRLMPGKDLRPLVDARFLESLRSQRDGNIAYWGVRAATAALSLMVVCGS